MKFIAMPSFKEKVFKIVREIPEGRILTYKDVAKRAGRFRAWWAVGNILNKNQIIDNGKITS